MRVYIKVNACFQVLATQPQMCTKRTKFHAKQQVFNDYINYYQASQTRTSSRIKTEPSFPDLLELHESSKFISKNIRTPLSAIPGSMQTMKSSSRRTKTCAVNTIIIIYYQYPH